MGNRKRYNWKGRQIVKTEIDNTETSKIKINLENTTEKYDECNQLILPSKKRPTKKQQATIKKTKILSKTQRKKLEKIVAKKKKKIKRSSLLEALAKVQAPPEELNQLTSVSSIQTKGLKRHFKNSEEVDNIFKEVTFDPQKIEVNSTAGSKRRKRILAAILSKNSELTRDESSGTVGFNDSASSGYSDEDFNECESQEPEEHHPEQVVTESSTNLIGTEENKCIAAKESVFKDKDNLSEKKVLVEETKGKETVEEKKRSPAVYVPVDRDPKIQKERMKLPILAEEQQIMETISENDVVIIAGETGSGKTTQVPQFLYEAGYSRNGKIIGITQPRRVATISTSERVAKEMNLKTDEISYLIRFEGNVTDNTKIKFMTDGVLLKEIQSDFILSKYSVIILDEAHERNVYTDILIGLLSRIVPLRKKRKIPLKLIIMSATLKVEDFTENPRLFKIPVPVLKVEGRQYPVSVHFNKRTSENYLKECFLKTCKIHAQLPEGGILIFVTGQQEVNYLVRKLRRTFPLSKKNEPSETDLESNSRKVLDNIKKLKKKMDISQIEINLNKYSIVPHDDTEIDLLDDDDLDIFGEDVEYLAGGRRPMQQPLWVLPMYSLLPSSEQAKVFAAPPEGCRLCVVSTNVAETSITIPHIKYVVDSGKTKVKLYDKTTGVTSFLVTWCSKASADQRAGRAGRVGPGHCYRLYSSAVFNDEFPQFSVPEIQQKPVDDLILQMKSMNIVKVLNFPFPTSPDLLQLRAGEKLLRILGALEERTGKDEFSGRLTKLGETMACFPVSPRFAKMLALSCQHDLLQYTVCVVAALSVQNVLLNDTGENKWAQFYRNWAGSGNSLLLGDIMVLLRAVGAAEYSKFDLEDFCLRNGLRQKAIVEIRKLRVQLTNQINLNIPGLNLIVDPNLKPPTDIQAKLLRQILLSGLGDHVAHKVDLDEIKESTEKIKWKRAYRHNEMEEPIHIHSSSVLRRHMPEWVVYQEVYETNKLYMRGLTAIEPEWLPVFVPLLCNLSEPLEEPPPRYDADTGKVFCHVSGTFGKAAFSLPVLEMPFTNNMSSYKWFAQFFLEGEVFPKLRRFKSSLLSAPTVMTKSWAKLQSRTEKLLTALISKEANTRDKVLAVWKEDFTYLLEAYKAWLPESAHESVTLIWPPLENSTGLDGESQRAQENKL